MNKIIIFLLLLTSNSILWNKAHKIIKPIGKSYQAYPECVEEAKESLHPSYDLKSNIDYGMNALDLLVWWRFDIIAKYIFGLHRDLKVKSSWAEDLYLAHQRVWSNCYEADGSKQDCSDFLTTFKKTLDSIKNKGFDPQKGKIKIDISKYPCDGSHRIASCILFNKPIVCYHSPEKKHCTYSSATFFKHYAKIVPGGLEDKYLDSMAFEYCQLKKNSQIIVIPASKDNVLIKKAIRSNGAIVYSKEFNLNKKGINNLYDTLPEQTMRKKIDHPKDMLFDLFVCEFDDQDNQILNEISSIATSGYIITTAHASTMALAQSLLLGTSIKILNERKLKNMHSLKTSLSTLQKLIEANQLTKEHLCIFEEPSHEAYELKGNRRILAIYHSNNTEFNLEVDKVSIQSSDEFDDVIFNPTRHFYYKGFKFAVPLD